MFASALQTVEKFVRPVVVSKRLYSGKVESGIATFIVVNEEGWILTAAHVFSDLIAHHQHMQDVAEYNTASFNNLKRIS